MALLCILASSPGAPIFSTAREKRGEPDKTYHVRDVRWNQLPYMAQQRVGQDQAEFEFFNQYVTIGYESARGDASASSLCVKNCDLHGNSIVSTLGGTDLDVGTIEFTMQIAAFDTQQRD